METEASGEPDKSSHQAVWSPDMMPKRSFGLKLLLVCALALVMAIPALFVFSVVYDRSSRANTAIEDVSARYGGEQVAMGPVLTLPYTIPVITEDDKVIRKRQTITLYPESGQITANLATEVKSSGIHEIPIYATDISFSADFNPARIQALIPEDATPEWNAARLIVSMSDSTTVRSPTQISLGADALAVEPFSSQRRDQNNYYGNDMLTELGAFIPDMSAQTAPFKVTAKMSFTGAQAISFAAFARNTSIDVSSDWDDPKFSGAFQWSTYNNSLDEEGFTANWVIPYEARGIPGAGTNRNLSEIRNAGARVEIRLIQNATPYQSVQRALKYALMFIGFVFLAYFLFEISSQQKAHPAQYILVGLAQAVFYLLLLAMAEQFGFDLAFLVASIMTVGLTSAYAMTVFKDKKYGLRALGVFSGVYLLIYVLMRLEDYALLVGALASFTAIGFTMFMTRNIDWYGMTSQENSSA